MAFKFRLETSLRLANQEMDIVQGLLAQETRKMQEFIEQRNCQALNLAKAWDGQRNACMEAPYRLKLWQKYSAEQREKLIVCEKQVEKQEKVVEEHREKLIECRIKVEKYKRLKEKKLRLYFIEELKKEQNVIDEIAQGRAK